MERIKIALTPDHRGTNSTTFTGRTEGEAVRKTLDLSSKDNDNNKYEITIPPQTPSFNPSFYLGLFFDSIKKLRGLDAFKEKYSIVFLDTNSTIKNVLQKNIEECERKANNEYLGKTGINILL